MGGSVPLKNVAVANPTTGRPRNVCAPTEIIWWTPAVATPPTRLSLSQPSWNVMPLMSREYGELNTFEELNVTMFASQHSAEGGVAGDGGENVGSGPPGVCSSRSQNWMPTSSHAPPTPKLRWNSCGGWTLPAFFSVP